MKLQKKGLLSDCEHLLTPLTTDQEGNLRGGFGDFGGISTCGANRDCKNRGCKNYLCNNVSCNNNVCTNAECLNDEGSVNFACQEVPTTISSTIPTKPVTPETTLAANTKVDLCGLL